MIREDGTLGRPGAQRQKEREEEEQGRDEQHDKKNYLPTCTFSLYQFTV